MAEHGDHDRHDQEADDEGLRGNRRDELALGDEKNSFHHAATSFTKTSSSVGRAISMRAGGTAIARRGITDERAGALAKQDLAAARVGALDALDLGNSRQRREVRARLERVEFDDARIVAPSESPDTGSSSTFRPLLIMIDVIAELLGMRHHVRREQDRRAARVLLEHHLPEAARAHRVEAAERLVENQQIGVVDDRGDELDFLLHAF